MTDQVLQLPTYIPTSSSTHNFTLLLLKLQTSFSFFLFKNLNPISRNGAAHFAYL